MYVTTEHSPSHYFWFQDEKIVVANVGDSRAVLATTSDDGDLVAVQLTIDFKPNLPREFAAFLYHPSF